MKIIFISDTHGKHEELQDKGWLKEADMIIHAGDISNRGRPRETTEFLDWFAALPYKHRVFIAGNHDFYFEETHHQIPVNKLLAQYPGITYLENNSVTIEGIKIYGSPYSPRFYDWAFNVDRGNPIAREWSKIPMDTDILITHGPPLGHGDRTDGGDRAGCADLLKRIEIVQPIINVYGHIHEGWGMYGSGTPTTFINASVLNSRYEMVNMPIIIDYENFL